jgi:hypothetical protein
MEYLEGVLRKNSIERFEVYDVKNNRDFEITSGCVIEVQIAGNWVKTRIESGMGCYYAVEPGVQLLPGLKVRVKIR